MASLIWVENTPYLGNPLFSLFRVLAACFSQGPWDAFFFSRPPAPLVLVSCAFACSGVGPVVGYSLSRGETVGTLAGLGFYAPNRRAHRPFRPFQAPCFSPLSGTHASLSCSLLKGGTSTLCVDPSPHWAPVVREFTGLCMQRGVKRSEASSAALERSCRPCSSRPSAPRSRTLL